MSFESSGRSSPDPSETANVYCAGRLDDLIAQGILPFWNELQHHDPQRCWRLWLVRYGCGGEHLKVRLHGPEEQRPLVRRLLADAVHAFFAGLGPAPPSVAARSDAPPIDAEDSVAVDYPDRTLLWTSYRRSQISLGSEPYLLDNRYTALLTRCLAEGTDRTLDSLSGGGTTSHSLRQTTLLKALISGLSVIGPAADGRLSYLAYHRDWLLRFTLLKSRADSAKAAELLAHFERRIETMGPTLDQLRRIVATEATGDEGVDTSWRGALRNLLEYITPLGLDPRYHVDAYASEPNFVPLFKVFHGLANQLGLKMLDEAFAHQLLLRAWAAEPCAVVEAGALR
jgi:hypothetical protein